MADTPKMRIYPNSFETEEAMLSCFFQRSILVQDIVPRMDDTYFYNARHKKVFNAIKDLYTAQIDVDVISVNDYLERKNNSESDMLEYLSDLSQAVRSTASVNDYFKILKRDKILRDIIDICTEIINEAYSATDEGPLLQKAEKLIYDVSKQRDRRDLRPIKDPMSDLMTRIDVMSKNKGMLRGLTTGFPILDSVTNGLQPGNLIILAARPSVGKTAFALNLVANAALANPEKPKCVAFFSLEMADVELAQRLMCTKARVSMTNVTKGDVKSTELRDMWLSHKEFYNSELYVDDTTDLSPQEVLSKIRRLSAKQREGVSLVVVDYLQLMESDKKRSESRQQDVSDISRKLKLIAKEINCPVIALCQMSRGIEGRTDKNPMLSDLRESGSLEQDADIVMFLSREHEDQKTGKQQTLVLSIAKHRNGSLRNIRYVWEGDFVSFTESDDQENVAVSKTKSE